MNETAIAKLREILPHLSPDSPNHAYGTAAKIQAEKNEVVSRYGPMFAPENLDRLTPEEFRSFLPLENNRHWNGLQRHGNWMTEDMDRLRDALKILVDESRPISSRLDELHPKAEDAMVRGFGRAVITAILQVEYPERYGVLNNTVESGMRDVGLWPKCESGALFGQRYEIVNQVLVEAAPRVGVDLWTLDTLWWVWLSADGKPPVPTPISMTESVLRLERYLHEFLVDNWDRLDLAKEWALWEDEDGETASHYHADEVGEIDLLAKHRSRNKWLVIELKRDQSSDATVGQLLRYMGWVRRKLAKGEEEVNGLVICSGADTKMRYALDCVPNVQCMTYQVSFALKLVPTLE